MNVPFGGEDILQLVETPEIPDPVEGTPACDNALARDESTYKISAMPWLPQLPESWAQELHDRIEAAEREYAAPNLDSDDYYSGTATEPDERAIVRGTTEHGYLFTAEHATRPRSWRTGEMRFPDAGTGGLAAVMAEDYGTAIIMRGMQTSNVPSDPNHPIKPEIARGLVRAQGFLSVHGKAPGMFVHQSDRSEIHACIGLGIDPPELLREFAQQVVRVAKDELGLYVVISNDQSAYIQQRGGTALKRQKDGSVKLSRLAALGPAYTTNFSQSILRASGRAVPAFQMELTNSLRLTPAGGENARKDPTLRTIGVALGYKLLEKVVELTPAYNAAEAEEG